MGVYLALRILLRCLLGKKRRDRLFVVHQLDFATFMYRILKLLRLHHSVLLRLDSPEYGYKFYCRMNRDDLVFMTGHEDELMKYFNPAQGNIMVDVGAHIGAYTIMASKHVGEKGKVIAIEADPANFKILERNIKLNHLTNVIALNIAAFSNQTKLKLYLPEQQSGRTIYNTVISSRAVKEHPFVEVKADTLDRLLNLEGFQTIDWLKIDVEGGEYDVLKGAHNTISKSKGLSLMVEVHGSEMYRLVTELLNAQNCRIIIEQMNQNHDWGYIIAQKSQ
jgi:FkbM family methyltransferase